MDKRRIKYLFCIAYLGLCLQAQAQIHFLGSYGGLRDESFPKILGGTNNTILLAGSTQSFPYNNMFAAPWDFYAVLTDTSGQYVWDKYEGLSSEDDFLYGAVGTFDGGYLFVGDALFQGGWGFGDTRILKLDAEGSLIYSKLLGVLLPNFGNDVCRTLDSNYVIAGACVQSGNSFPLLAKINEVGDTLWVRTHPQNSISYLNKIINAQDGGFFSTTFEVGSSYPILLKYSSSGEIEWVQPFNELGTEFIDVTASYGLCEGNVSGTFWTLADGFSSLSPNPMCGNFNGFLHLVEFDQGGNVVRKETFCDTDTSANNYRCLAKTADGGVILGGIGLLKKLNADWEEEWVLETTYNIVDIIQHNDGYYYATGEIFTNNTNFFLLKINPDGTNSVELVETKNGFSIYPNPVSHQLTLESSFPGIIYYSFYTIDGRIVETGSFVSRYDCNTEKLGAGSYYLEMADQAGNILYRKLISKQ